MNHSSGQVIVGAGFAGLCMAIKLRAEGMDDFVILERNDAPGGTWYDNTYPGAACDVESHLYSFSFEPNPRWSRQFSPQQEILAYMEHCIDKYDLRRHLRLGVTVERAVYNEQDCVWILSTTRGDEYTTAIMITCTGGLSQPSMPDIKGIDRYKGHVCHTARWDKSYDLSGKKVAVIGTGASAIQVVPAIVDQVDQLMLFQRTPAWVIAKSDAAISARKKEMYRKWPVLQRFYRIKLYWRHEVMAIAFVVNPGLMKVFGNIVLRHLKHSVPNAELRAKLTPNYVIGCKRILLSNDYYPALQRRNVQLITTRIEEIDETGVRTCDGVHHPADAIIMATGFKAADEVMRYEVQGRQGAVLNALWRKSGAEAYLGTTVAGFPNMYIIVGPNTGLGHSSMLLMIEAQVHYIMEALKTMKNKHLQSLEVKEEVQKQYNLRLQKDLSNSVWQSGGCQSWYQRTDGKNVTLWPDFTFTFMKKTSRFEIDQYEVGR